VAQERLIEATPAWVGVPDEGRALIASFWLSYQKGTIARYEVRSWPGMDLIAEIPVEILEDAGDADESRGGVRPFPTGEAPLIISPDGRLFAAGSNHFLHGCRGIHLVDLRRADVASTTGETSCVWRLDGSLFRNARLGSFLFSPDSQRLLAMYIPHLVMLARDWMPQGPPDLAAFDANVTQHELWVRGWCTATRQSMDAEDHREPLFQALRESLRSPNVTETVRPRVVHLMEAEHMPQFVRRLWQRWIAFRLRRISVRLQKSLPGAMR
jgi:hypothetical protein